MSLRELQYKDASLMLEWMHDDSVVHDLKKDFGKLTLEDCNRFISQSINNDRDYNLAIVNDKDEYQGTVSLKNISKDDGSAEFGIVVRKCAMGKGSSKEAMREILRRGFENLHLDYIYWCVSPKNVRAVRFYDKNNYSRIDVNELDTAKICGGGTQQGKFENLSGIKKKIVNQYNYIILLVRSYFLYRREWRADVIWV